MAFYKHYNTSRYYDNRESHLKHRIENSKYLAEAQRQSQAVQAKRKKQSVENNNDETNLEK